jgi:uncharacterized protein YbjT (DUF2867 family)
MILVTGAAGKTGLAFIQALVAREAAVRALVRRDEQVQRVMDAGAGEVLSGDMQEPGTMQRAMLGVRAVYHIPPNVNPDELVIGRTVIAAAQAEGVEHFVYHSVLHPQTETMPHHWLKMRVEEMIFESGLPFTILQPAAYMQNVLVHWDSIIERSVYPVPYSVEARLSMVDLRDVASAAALVLTENGHVAATYELVGTAEMSQVEVAGILSEQLGRTVNAEYLPLDSWEQKARAASLGDYQVETLVKMFQYYDRHGLSGNPAVLGWILGRPPTNFAQFVERTAHEQQLKEY